MSAARRAGAGVVVVLSIGVAVYAAAAYALLPLGGAVHADMRPTFTQHGAALYVHVFASVFALVLGPFQFWPNVRARRPVLHRWSGRLYLGVGIFLGGLAALVVAFGAFGGPVARLGFASLAVAWLFSGFRAYQAIRARDVQGHRRWMVRNFSLTFAAVTLRLWLPALVVSGVPFGVAYALVAWLCWLPNLAVAEWLFNARAALVPEAT